MISVESGCPDGALERAIEEVQNESKRHEAIKITASHAVKRLSTSAVDVPKSELPDSPPNEAPKPVLLLSWIKIVAQSKTQRSKNKKIAAK
jgi:hypothetical protein